MTADRITQIRVAGLRVLKDVRLDVRGMNVLIGDNGTGKSTLLEAFELLCKAGAPGIYTDNVLNNQHGPFTELLRRGTSDLTLGVVIEGAGPKIEYSFTATLAGTSCAITDELLDVHMGSSPFHALRRNSQGAHWLDKGVTQTAAISTQMLAAASAAQGLVTQEPFVRLSRALQAIEYHPPFDVRPVWQQQELEMRTGPRWPARPDSTRRVRRYGHEFPAALFELRNHADLWERFLTRARVVLGPEFETIALEHAGAGQMDVTLNFRSQRRSLPLRGLSEGQLSYLLLLATVELGAERGLLALDEPDIHYHPDLIVNLVQILEEVALTRPVVLATHSDRVLDAIGSPGDSVVLCELDSSGDATFRRPNPDGLSKWLEHYRGLGAVREEGYQAHVFDDGPTAGTDTTQ